MAPLDYIPIVLVKEYYWCPVSACLKLTMWMERETYSMMAGRLDGRSRGRLVELLAEMGVDGEMLWEYPVASQALMVRGRVDLLIDHGSSATIVEAKLTLPGRGKDSHIKAQLAAYSIAVEETLHKPVARTLLYLVEDGRIVEVRVKPYHRRMAEAAARALWAMARRGCADSPPARRIRCRVCSYRGVCPALLTSRRR